MTHLEHPTTGSTNFDDVFAYWDAYWGSRLKTTISSWPGIVDFEEGEIAGGGVKSSPQHMKGIYPNKNMEKSKLFYGVRGVRQTIALFKNKVDDRYPRVILNYRMMHCAGREKGIFYLATVDNYDRIEWYRTGNKGITWQKLHATGANTETVTIDCGNCGFSYCGTKMGNSYAGTSYQSVPTAVPSDYDGVALEYGSLPGGIPIGGNPNGNSGFRHGGHTDVIGIKCRVYKGELWAESDIILANGCTIKNVNGTAIYTRPIINIEIGFDGASTVTSNRYTYTITHRVKATTISATSLQWQESTDYGVTWVDMEDEKMPELIIGTWTGATATDEETAIDNAIATIPAYDRYIRCVAIGAAEDTISDAMHIVYEEGHGTPVVT